MLYIRSLFSLECRVQVSGIFFCCLLRMFPGTSTQPGLRLYLFNEPQDLVVESLMLFPSICSPWISSPWRQLWILIWLSWEIWSAPGDFKAQQVPGPEPMSAQEKWITADTKDLHEEKLRLWCEAWPQMVLVTVWVWGRLSDPVSSSVKCAD